MKKTSKSILILVTLIIILILYLINSNLIIKSVIDYSLLFLTKLFPVNLLFFIFSYLLINYGLIELLQHYLNINTSNLYVLLLSAISGFPSGAKYTKELYNKNLIDLESANKIIRFSHFPNPLFVLGSVSLVLKDNNLCLKLLLSLFLSNIIIFIFTKKNKTKIPTNYKTPTNFSNILSKAIKDSFDTLLLIYGTSLFFYLISTIITKYISLDPNSFILLNGLFDLTKGVFSTTLIDNITKRAFYILLFISFGGISIHMQVKSILADTPIKYKYFLQGRIIGTILAFLIFLIAMQ